MTQPNPTPSDRDDDLETIKEIMMTVARRCDNISEIQQQNTYAIADTRRDFQWLEHQIDRNATAIEQLTDRIDRMGNRIESMGDRIDSLTNRIDRLATLQGQTNATLQQFIRRMDTEVRQIWERIQQILVELRNRFPGHGRG